MLLVVVVAYIVVFIVYYLMFMIVKVTCWFWFVDCLAWALFVADFTLCVYLWFAWLVLVAAHWLVFRWLVADLRLLCLLDTLFVICIIDCLYSC